MHGDSRRILRICTAFTVGRSGHTVSSSFPHRFSLAFSHVLLRVMQTDITQASHMTFWPHTTDDTCEAKISSFRLEKTNFPTF